MNGPAARGGVRRQNVIQPAQACARLGTQRRVDDAGDVVIEDSSGAFIDEVESSISFELPDYVETLTLTGSAAIDGAGNGSDNTITGNDADNSLEGGGGNDHER